MILELEDTQVRMLVDIVGMLGSEKVRENKAMRVVTLHSGLRPIKIIECTLCENSWPNRDEIDPIGHQDDCPVYLAAQLNQSVNLEEQKK